MNSAIRASQTLGLLALVAVTSPFAIAADSGLYIGGNVGQSRADIDEARIAAAAQGAGLTTTSIASDEHDIGFKLFLGYRFTRHFAIEGGFFDLGKFNFTATTVPAGTLSGEMKVRGGNLDAVGILPINEKFSLFGRVGVTHAKTRDSFGGTGAVVVLNPSPTERDTNPKVGVGLQYDFNESLGVRAEAERYRISDAVGGKGNIDLLSVGLVWRFGGRTPPPAPRAAPPEPRPAPVAPAPPPPPPARAVQPPPPPQAVTPAPPPPSEKPVRRDRN